MSDAFWFGGFFFASVAFVSVAVLYGRRDTMRELRAEAIEARLAQEASIKALDDYKAAAAKRLDNVEARISELKDAFTSHSWDRSLRR